MGFTVNHSPSNRKASPADSPLHVRKAQAGPSESPATLEEICEKIGGTLILGSYNKDPTI